MLKEYLRQKNLRSIGCFKSGKCTFGVSRHICNSQGGRRNFGGGEGLILGGNSSSAGRQQPGRLIIPGQSANGPPKPGKLVIPENDIPLGNGDGVEGIVSSGPPTLNKFRPPAGFMNDEIAEESSAKMEASEMLQRIQMRSGYWHDLAKFIPALFSQGYDSGSISELTGLTPVEQNKWVVSATVYDSLKQSKMFPSHMLEAFNSTGIDLLHPFRFLSVDRRVAAAIYILENELEEPQCEILARAMKDYERRVNERVGFSNHPGDCMAFKYYRDAVEARKQDEKRAKVDQGLDVAVTEDARTKLKALIEEKSQEPAIAASLTILRLNPDELGTRPMPVVGVLGEATAADLASAPRTTQEGVFGVFSIIGEQLPKYKWVSLPQWRALSMSRLPACFQIADCSIVPSIVTCTSAKTQDDLRRLQGPGLLVMERYIDPEAALDEKALYMVSEAGKETAALKIVDGQRLSAAGAELKLMGSVIFLARPPIRNTLAAETSELLEI